MMFEQNSSQGTENKNMNVNSVLSNINNNKKFNQVNDEYVNYDEAKKQVNSSNKPPEADVFGEELADEFKTKLLYNLESNTWMFYEFEHKGVWAVSKEETIQSLIFQQLRQKGIIGYHSNSYITNILSAMRHTLLENKWNEKSPKQFLPFQNGVLEIATGKLLPHSPGYRFTWCLPREYNPLAEGFPNIHNWLNEATGNNSAIKEVLLCYLNAILKGRADLQQFLYLIGVAGSGKSTFIRLAEMLIGTENTYSTSLGDFCSNRFESANVYKKRLVVFPDQDKYSRKLQKFKSLTGQDKINAEEKGKSGFQFEFDGMVILACNKDIFVGDNSSWLTRRILPITFDNPVPKNQRRDLTEEFELELSALTKYLLSITDEKVTQVLRNAVDDIPEVGAKLKEQKINADSLAAWINECIIHDPEAFTPSGKDKDDTSSLFGNYYHYCLKTGVKPKSQNNFKSDLQDMCKFELGWTDVKPIKKRVNTTNPIAVLSGLKLRTDNDNHIPYPFEECAGTTNNCSTTQNNLEPNQDKDCSDCSDCSDSNTTTEIMDDDSRITFTPKCEEISTPNDIISVESDIVLEHLEQPEQFSHDKDFSLESSLEHSFNVSEHSEEQKLMSKDELSFEKMDVCTTS